MEVQCPVVEWNLGNLDVILVEAIPSPYLRKSNHSFFAQQKKNAVTLVVSDSKKQKLTFGELLSCTMKACGLSEPHTFDIMFVYFTKQVEFFEIQQQITNVIHCKNYSRPSHRSLARAW